MAATTWAPSPTDAATRLTDPERTSPTANTPGRLVSRRNGCRRAFHRDEATREGPVTTKALASFSISAGSHSLRFRAATRGGKPVAAWFLLPVKFELNPADSAAAAPAATPGAPADTTQAQ